MNAQFKSNGMELLCRVLTVLGRWLGYGHSGPVIPIEAFSFEACCGMRWNGSGRR